MPPSGLRSRNLAIGEPSPSGSSSSIFVFGKATNTVVTPWSGCGTAAETSAPSTSRYSAAALPISCTAMATWLSLPIKSHLLRLLPVLYDDDVHMADRFFAPALGNGGANCPPQTFGNLIRVAAPRLWQCLKALLDGAARHLRQSRSAGIGLRYPNELDFRITGERALLGHGDR